MLKYAQTLLSDLQLHSNMDKGDGNVRYVLTGDGAGSLFVIDEKSGDIHATKRLDREEKAMYTLNAKVLDRTTNDELEPDTEFNIKIHDINDNAPKFEKDIYFASVPEMSEVGKFWFAFILDFNFFVDLSDCLASLLFTRLSFYILQYSIWRSYFPLHC